MPHCFCCVLTILSVNCVMSLSFLSIFKVLHIYFILILSDIVNIESYLLFLTCYFVWNQFSKYTWDNLGNSGFEVWGNFLLQTRWFSPPHRAIKSKILSLDLAPIIGYLWIPMSLLHFPIWFCCFCRPLMCLACISIFVFHQFVSSPAELS